MSKLSIAFISILCVFSIHNHCLAQSSENDTIASYDYFDDEDDFESYEPINLAEIKDPLEKYNRKIFAFNDAFDRYFLEFVAKTYRNQLPKPVRKAVRNFTTNLFLPVSAVNSILQGKKDNSLSTLSHFLINSTIGLGGLFDVAGHKGIQYNNEDFGQTLGHYGVGSGFYIVLPFLGPSSARDFGGLIVDKSINPVEFNLLKVGGNTNLVPANYRLDLAAISGIDKREALLNIIQDIRKESFDPYATIKSAYVQKRNSDIKN